MRKRGIWHARLTILTLALAASSARVSAQSHPDSGPPTDGVIISGSVTDARKLPVVGAVITARGPAVGWTATLPNGSFVMHVAPGSYEILVRKGSYTPQTAEIVVSAGFTRTLKIELREANLGSISVGSGNSGAGLDLNAQGSASATLTQNAITERPQPTLQTLALEMPGLTLAHPDASEPNTSLVVRGGTVETRVQIDGHAVSAGATGRWNSSHAALPLFDSIEVAKGAGVSGADAGESAFGTVNLRTREFTRGQQADLSTGIDNFGGSYSTVGLSGTTMSNDRLSYVFQHSIDGYNGPGAGKTVNNAVAEPNGTALLVSKISLSAPFSLGSDLAKLRWRFSSSTSLTVAYIGIHGDYAESGGAFGTYLGRRTIVPSAPYAGGDSGAPVQQYSSPQYPGTIGTTVPAYSIAHNTGVQTNQPLFEAELRTAIHNDTLLIRPYVGTIYNVLDGSGRSSGPDPSDGGAWAAVTTGAGCSIQQPCLVPNSASSAYRNQELDRLNGATVTLIHPVGDAALNVSYDYRSDTTTVTSGDPSVAFNGSLSSINGYLTSIPMTVAHNFDWSATYTVPLTTRLTLAVGDYYTDWNLHYGTVTNIEDFATGMATRTIGWAQRSSQHDDPHLSLSWRPENDTTYRFSAGSAITVPYADLVAGGFSTSGPFTSTGVVSAKNPALQPESTMSYNVGMDHRFRNATIATLDAFDNTIHNVFATQVTPFNGAAFGIPAGSPFNALFATVTEPLNAPIERNYGLELALTNAPVVGIGYHLAATLQRAYLDQLPASFFSAQSSLINGKQLDGSTSIPYTHAYGELTFRERSGIAGALGADYTGTNNWTNGPAFVTWTSMLRYDLRGGYRTQFSVENLLNKNTANAYAAGTAGTGFASVNYGSRIPGALPTFGATSTTRFAIAPRTYRFQVEAHLGH
jgi:outer membrane cobalamin receptor